MCHRHDKLYVTHALTTHFLLGHLYTATVAHDAFITDTFVLSAMALIVFYRAENTLAEKTVALGLVGAIVDGFGFQHFTAGLFEDFLGRSQAYRDF